MWIILICIKNETLIEIKTSLENLWQRTIQLSDFFFQYSMVLIPNRKCVVGGSRIRCGESGTPTIIYTRWSSRYDGIGCHAPMIKCACVGFMVTVVNLRIQGLNRQGVNGTLCDIRLKMICFVEIYYIYVLWFHDLSSMCITMFCVILERHSC